jgi:hypothetical protein
MILLLNLNAAFDLLPVSTILTFSCWNIFVKISLRYSSSASTLTACILRTFLSIYIQFGSLIVVLPLGLAKGDMKLTYSLCLRYRKT